MFKVKVTVKVQSFGKCLSGQYLGSVSMMMHHHESEYVTKILFCYFQDQSHNHLYKIFRNTQTFATQNGFQDGKTP